MNRLDQPSRAPATIDARTPEDLAPGTIPLEALNAVTGGGDDSLIAHELTHVAQQRR